MMQVTVTNPKCAQCKTAVERMVVTALHAEARVRFDLYCHGSHEYHVVDDEFLLCNPQGLGTVEVFQPDRLRWQRDEFPIRHTMALPEAT